MKTVGRIVGMLFLLLVGAAIIWFAYARPAVSSNTVMQEQLAATQSRAANAEARVKELVDNPIVTTKVVTQEVKVEVPVEKIVEVTKVITVEVPAEAGIQAQTPLVLTGVLDANTACRHAEWFNGANAALNTTTDVAGLLAKLDRDYVLTEGGQWSNGGFTVPAGSVFWTDLLKSNLPTYVFRIRTEGNWGVYATAQDYTIPSPNGGGRFVRICEGVVGIPVQKTAPPTPVSATAKLPTCVTSIEVGIITGAENPGKEYDSFFEGKGYLYGKAFKPGETANAGWLLHANAAVFTTTEPIKLEGGRGMPICK